MVDYDLHPLREDERDLSEGEIRVRRCSEAIQGALKRFGCRLDVSVLVTSRGNRPNLDIIPVEEFRGAPAEVDNV